VAKAVRVRVSPSAPLKVKTIAISLIPFKKVKKAAQPNASAVFLFLVKFVLVLKSKESAVLSSAVLSSCARASSKLSLTRRVAPF
jgi:hypothetical protein